MRFPSLVWVVLAGTLLTRTAFFMVWPFLAIILERDFALPPSQIGSILGSALLAAAVIGFYAGSLSDRFGSGVVMTVGSFSAVVSYAVLAMAGSVTAYAAGAFAAGLSRAVLEAPGKAVIADYIQDQGTRDRAFHVRYFLINVGGAVGPLIGLVFGLAAEQGTFWVATAAYGSFALILAAAFRRAGHHAHLKSDRVVSVIAAMTMLRRDRRFLLLLVAMLLSMSAYAQQESTLVQHVNLEGGLVAIRLVTALLVTNALTIVLFQFPLLRLLRRYDRHVRTYVGLGLFIAAFIAYALMPVEAIAPWIIATWVLSVGEAILFPTLQLQVDRLAPPGMKGSYFGAAGLSALGFGIGPSIGGFLLEYAGGLTTFLLTAASLVVCGVCYWLASRIPAGPAPAHSKISWEDGGPAV